MSNPLVTVICSCYNKSKFIEESLESVKQQTFKNFEVIIWDDASTDNSVEIIEKWIVENPQYEVIFVKNETNLGITRSLNKCINLSKGKYIQVLALDDMLLPWKLEKHTEILERSSNTDALLFTDALLIDDDSVLCQNRFIAYYKQYLSLKSGNFYEDLLSGNFIPGMSILLKRSALDDVGLFDEDLFFEDYDMWLRLARKYDFIFVNEPSVLYRFHENNTHKKLTKEMELSTFKILLKHTDNLGIKQLLESIILEKYFKNSGRAERDLFYNKYPPQNILDSWEAKGGSVSGYRFIRFFRNLINR